MHQLSEDDPAPDSLDYQSDVLCEHGTLALNNQNRRKISEQVNVLSSFLSPATSLAYRLFTGGSFFEEVVSLLGTNTRQRRALRCM